MLKKFIGFFILIFLITSVLEAQDQPAQESDQQISDFSLAGFGEKGKKNWDLSGKSADIFTDTVKLKDIIGNLYGKQEDVKLTADRGDFNKVDAKVHLEENVVITTSSGAKLTTDSLDCDRKNQLITTKDMVNIEKDNMVTIAQGATGQPNLNKLTLERDVQVNINPAATEKQDRTTTKNKIIITCDGPLQIDYEKNIATFNNNVKVDRQDSQIYSDVMDVHFIKPDKDNTDKSNENVTLMGTKIDKIVARGNVKIVQGDNISYCDEAIYTALDKKITLSGKPKLIIYSTEGLNAPSRN